ncbi:hypothetical protein NDU88_002296 [Pleurodeles waltl]|uniref:Uncharacterized protein n=1 Tax=Pleurodeles waltl TaxID=8319 RepID=A0AAV7MMR4_PLEWA|nr:hypothetical protein NDU88_002296 [Pleurodeles waltl]
MGFRCHFRPCLHPGHKEQSEEFRAITHLHKGDGSDETRRTSGKDGAGKPRRKTEKTRKKVLCLRPTSRPGILPTA